MKENKMKILLIIILFQIIFCQNISNFDEVTVNPGKSIYYYQFLECSIPGENDAYFFFNFTNAESINLTIIEEDNNENVFDSISKNTWTSYYIKNLTSQIFMFEIINNANSSGKMIFIDGTKDINTSLETFANLNFSTEYFEKPPLSLFFNIDDIADEEHYYIFEEKKNSKESIVGGDFLLNYCLLSEKECNYTGLKILHFEKEKKYRIKLNFYKNNDNNNYFFKKFVSFLYFIKEIEFGISEFETNGIAKFRYFY